MSRRSSDACRLQAVQHSRYASAKRVSSRTTDSEESLTHAPCQACTCEEGRPGAAKPEDTAAKTGRRARCQEARRRRGDGCQACRQEACGEEAGCQEARRRQGRKSAGEGCAEEGRRRGEACRQEGRGQSQACGEEGGGGGQEGRAAAKKPAAKKPAAKKPAAKKPATAEAGCQEAGRQDRRGAQACGDEARCRPQPRRRAAKATAKRAAAKKAPAKRAAAPPRSSARVPSLQPGGPLA